jgi:hypothetical protein
MQRRVSEIKQLYLCILDAIISRLYAHPLGSLHYGADSNYFPGVFITLNSLDRFNILARI